MSTTLIAIPSEQPGGLLAPVGQHFGHCELFTLVEVKNGEVSGVTTLPNMPHEHGGCMAPVNYLAQNGVNALIAGGMGMRPLMGFSQVGIEVFLGEVGQPVSRAVEAFLSGGLRRFSPEFTCGGQDCGS